MNDIILKYFLQLRVVYRVLGQPVGVEQSMFLPLDDPRPSPHFGVNHVLQRSLLRLQIDQTRFLFNQIADVLSPEEVFDVGRKVPRDHARHEGDVFFPRVIFRPEYYSQTPKFNYDSFWRPYSLM